MFQAAVSAIGMGFSGRRNALYDETDAAALLATMCKEGMCAEQASEMLREQSGGGPGADWLLGKMGRMPYDTMHKKADRILHRTASDSIRHGLVERFPLVAIDKTKIARYDKKPDMVHLIKYKGGSTSTAEAYITARTVGCPNQTHLACLPVTRDAFNPEFVRKLLRKIRILNVRPRLLLMDRESCAVDVLKTVARAGLRFLVPAVRTPGVKRAMREYADGRRDAVSTYAMASRDGARMECTMIMLDRTDSKGERFQIAFVTNHAGCTRDDILELPEEYRRRWGIETGYRDAKRAMPRTCSRKDHVRLILFYLSLVASNIWMIVRAGGRGAAVRLRVMLAGIIRECAGLRIKKPPDPG